MADYGGRAFKKALIRKLIASEDDCFMDDIVYNHLKKTGQTDSPARPESKKSMASSAEDVLTSCEVSLAEEEERETEEDPSSSTFSISSSSIQDEYLDEHLDL